MKIVLSKVAKIDLKEIVDYIKRDSAKYAFVEKEKIKAAVDKLKFQPLLGRIMKELPDSNFRELALQNYRIIHKVVSDKQINILSIHHHARSMGNNPAFTEDE